MKVRIFGHDDETVLASVIPDHAVICVSQTGESHVR